MSQQDDQYDLSPDPPPIKQPVILPSKRGTLLQPIQDLDVPKRFTWSERWFYILRRLVGIPLIVAGGWWMWHCANFGPSLSILPGTGAFAIGIGAVPIAFGLILLFYGGPSDSEKKGYHF
jgi:hypothetical protein